MLLLFYHNNMCDVWCFGDVDFNILSVVKPKRKPNQSGGQANCSFLKVRISLDLIVFKDQIQVTTSQMVI